MHSKENINCTSCISRIKIICHFHRAFYLKGLARTQIPTNRNYAIEFPTFGEIAGVNPTEVQWKGLALEEPPS